MPQKIKYPIIDGFKKCADCERMLPVEEFNKARNYLTSRCKSCIKIYHKAYRDRPDVKEKAAEYAKSYLSDTENRAKINARSRSRNKRRDVMDKRNKNRRDWTNREKLKAIEYKGGACVICGYNKCCAALDFHHLDPSQKERPAMGAIYDYKKFEDNIAELDKCILLCSNCHRELHYGEIRYESGT
jgi:predicted HNH restriction endonuclease